MLSLPRSIEKLRIVFYPDAVLRKRCKPVEEFDDSLDQLATRMLELMRQANGVGLAAPQVGVPVRLFVCNATGESQDDRIWVNPVLSQLEGATEAEEGCLSLPGVSVLKRRAANAVIDGFDVHGQPIRAEGSDLLVRIWQHETDHLNGVLVIDDMSEVAEMANRRAIRQLESGETAKA